MTPVRARQALLALLLALSLAASWWVHRQEENADTELAAPVDRASSVPASASPVSGTGVTPVSFETESVQKPLDLNRLRARQLDGTDIDPFRTKSWFVAPPPPPPEPPPKPAAPPLPFQFVGKTTDVDGEKAAIYLANGNEFYTVSVGDTFASTYRLERVDRGALVIRYLPLSIIQTLPIGISE